MQIKRTGSVKEYIYNYIKKDVMHMTLLDPEKQDGMGNTQSIVRAATEAGTAAFMVGGSTGIDFDIVDRTVKDIKEISDLPVILFPTNASSISPSADAIYFMTIMNSRDAGMIMGEQAAGAPMIQKMGLEPISMGYIIVEPGMKVGQVSKSEPLPRGRPELAVKYALAAQYFGFSLVYLEAGSGAPEPVLPDMISMVRKNIDIPLVVGGGIRTAEQARTAAKAGANIIVTGTIVEEASNVKSRLKEIIDGIRSVN